MEARLEARGVTAAGDGHRFAVIALATLTILGSRGPAAAEQDRSSASEKGSLVVYPHVEVRWSSVPPYTVLQDTFLHLSNDFPAAVDVKLFFVNGDPPLIAEPLRGEGDDDAIRAERAPAPPTGSASWTDPTDHPPTTYIHPLAQDPEGDEHGIGIALGLDPRCEGESIFGRLTASYNDLFGDTTRIDEAYFRIGSPTSKERFPAEGTSLEIVEVFGNTTAVVGGSLPVLIGVSEGTLSGLPGLPNDGRVTFRVVGYDIPTDTTEDLRVFGSVMWADVCDDPDTIGCDPDKILEATAPANTGHHPRIEIAKTCNVPFVCEGEDTPVTYTYTVWNPGNVQLGSVMETIMDDGCAVMMFIGGDTDGDTNLDPSEVWTFECSTTISTGSTDTVTVTGLTGVPSCDATASDTLTIPVMNCGEERDHPGWNHFDNIVTLTANEPAYWSAATGLPKGVARWQTLDPADEGQGPGRPDPDDPSQRYLRGFVVAFAIRQVPVGDEIRWNHLAGDATIVNYREQHAWQYATPAFQVIDEFAHGAATGTPGDLLLDGTEYAEHGAMLLLNFIASNSDAYSGGGIGALHDTALTLMPLAGDFRSDTVGPRTTKATFDIWNQNEVKFTNLDQCVSCWSSTRLSRSPLPNHFLMHSLHTDAGKARIDGVTSGLCAPDEAFETALIGVATRLIAPGIVTGHNLFDIGRESGRIRYDAHDPPPEASGGMRRELLNP